MRCKLLCLVFYKYIFLSLQKPCTTATFPMVQLGIVWEFLFTKDKLCQQSNLEIVPARMGLSLCPQRTGSTLNSFTTEQIQKDAKAMYVASFVAHTKTVPGGNVRCISYWLTKMALTFPSASSNSDRIFLLLTLGTDLPFLE